MIILSEWADLPERIENDGRVRGITLELGAYSPSDSKYHFVNLLGQTQPYRDENEVNWRESPRQEGWPLTWYTFDRTRTGIYLMERVMGPLDIRRGLPDLSGFTERIPEVGVVTGLLIRRQFPRRILTGPLFQLIRESFTGLQWFRHEVWRYFRFSPESEGQQGMSRLHFVYHLDVVDRLQDFRDWASF